MATQAHRFCWLRWRRAARAIETLRGVVIELQMAPIKQEVNIGMEPYLASSRMAPY